MRPHAHLSTCRPLCPAAASRLSSTSSSSRSHSLVFWLVTGLLSRASCAVVGVALSAALFSGVRAPELNPGWGDGGEGGRHAGGKHGQSAATMLQRHPRAHISKTHPVLASQRPASSLPMWSCPSMRALCGALQCSTVLFLTGPALWCANGHFSFFSFVDFPASFAPPSAKIAFASAGFAAKFAFAAAGFAGLRLAGFAGFAAGFATLAAKLTTNTHHPRFLSPVP